MAIYKIRISFEDYDVMREIDIKSNQSFEDLHNTFHQAIGYKADVPSSFYVSNDFWHKGQEISILPDASRLEKKVSLMSASKLNNFIEDPHQKFYYTSNFDRPFDFHVELIRILIDADPKLTYPAVVKSQGEAPRQFTVVSPGTTKSGGIPESPELLLEEPEDGEEDEGEEEGDDFATHGSESIGEEDTGNLSEKESEEETDSEDEDGFGDFGGEDEEAHPDKEDY